jgi:hypothetical protein
MIALERARPSARFPSPLACAAWLLGASSFLSACGPSGPALSPAEQNARAVASIDARLRGPWTLQRFDPVTPLEPVLQGLLDLHKGRLVARFDGQRMIADSIALHVERKYQISEVAGGQFKLTTFDDQGVPYDSVCTFRDASTIDVSSASPPWRGVAVVTRGAPLLPTGAW